MANATYHINPPPLLLGASLLFWGWRTELLPLAVLMAVILESARYLSWRWEFSDKDFNRLVDLTSVVVLAMTVYLFATRSVYGIFILAQWLPILIFLIVSAQMYSSQGTLPLSALFLTLRRRKRQQDTTLAQRIDIRFPYFAVCMLAASTVTVRTPWFYAGICALVAWALWSGRPRRYTPALWGGLLLVAIGLGYLGHLGLNRVQHAIGDLVVEWMGYRLWSERDPYQATTAIGHIGRLKLSDRIVLRVKRAEGTTGSLLLRQASYNSYASGIWRAIGDQFEAVTETAVPGTWQFGESDVSGEAITVSGYFHRGRGLVTVPNGGYRIENLPAEFVKRNPYGAIKAENGPGVVSYTVRFRPDISLDDNPTEQDLHIPKRYAPVFVQVASELGLSREDPKAALAALERHFRDNFRYSLVQEGEEKRYTPLSDFLLSSRSGHCEYFATATALLLRAAGIPSRYAAGYSVQEYSELEDAYIVRRRHAHSWVLAYIDDTWRDVDFTPPAWVVLEDQVAPWWETIYDFGSRIAFLFSRWRWSERDGKSFNILVWLLMPLVLLFAWRLYFKKRIRARSKKDRRRRVASGPGSDSAFYRIIKHLEQSGIPRRPGETLNQWIQRVTDGKDAAIDKQALRTALGFHYRYRFDPRGLMSQEKERLQSTVSEWIARHE